MELIVPENNLKDLVNAFPVKNLIEQEKILIRILGHNLYKTYPGIVGKLCSNCKTQYYQFSYSENVCPICEKEGENTPRTVVYFDKTKKITIWKYSSLFLTWYGVLINNRLVSNFSITPKLKFFSSALDILTAGNYSSYFDTQNKGRLHHSILKDDYFPNFLRDNHFINGQRALYRRKISNEKYLDVPEDTEPYYLKFSYY
jgi:hypothetical protein